MHRHIRLLLAGLAATAMLAAVVGSAAAGRLSVSNKNFRITWQNLLFANTVTSGSVKCPVTLEGSFHSQTIRKVARALVGYITRAAVSSLPCTGGTVTVNQETLPWHLTYEGFIGTLPRIEGIRLLLVRDSWIINSEGNSCRRTTTTENPASVIANVGGSGQVTGLRADETRKIPLVNGPGGVFCGLGQGLQSGTGAVTLLGTNNAISIRLI